MRLVLNEDPRGADCRTCANLMAEVGWRRLCEYHEGYYDAIEAMERERRIQESSAVRGGTDA